MEAATELAGFFAAHAVWSVSDGETLIPLLGYEAGDGMRQLVRLASERIADGALAARTGWRRIPATQTMRSSCSTATCRRRPARSTH
jgi:hypothetical protein